MNVNRRNVAPGNFNGFLPAISLVNFPREFFLELFLRPASNKVKGAADENPGFAALIELWRKRSLIRVMRNSCG
jgi:hypothetical protein